MRTTSETLELLDNYIRSWVPLLAIDSVEERRVITAIAAQIANINQRIKKAYPANQAAAHQIVMYTWSETRGILKVAYAPEQASKLDLKPIAEGNSAEQYKTMKGALSWFGGPANETAKMVVVLTDPGAFFPPHNQATALARQLRDLVLADTAHMFILLQNHVTLPPTLERDGIMLDWPLPDPNDLDGIVGAALKSEGSLQVAPETRQRMVAALGGLTAAEATVALQMSVGTFHTYDERTPPFLLKSKALTIKRSRGVTIETKPVSVDEMGGNANLKAWMERKWRAYTPEAAAFGIQRPKGVLLAGPPGTGKTLCSRVMGGGRMPVAGLDPAALKGGIVGETEGNWLTALKTLEALSGGSGAIARIDEFDKFFSGGAGGRTTSGESIQDSVTGIILPWMQDQDAGVLVVATANDPTDIKSEVLARFAATFWVELPGRSDRAAILRIHLGKVNQKMSDDALMDLAAKIDGYSGRDIERLVNEGLERAFMASHKQIQMADLIGAMDAITPVAVLEAQNIKNARDWASKANVQLASPPESTGKGPGDDLIYKTIKV